MRTAIIDQQSEFLALKSVWDEIKPAFLMQDFNWNYTWWDVYQTSSMQLCIIVCYEQQQVIGIAPFYIHSKTIGWSIGAPLKSLQLLGTGEAAYEEVVSEYLDIICQPQNAQPVTKAIAGIIESSLSVDSIIFNDFTAESNIVKYLVAHLQRDQWHIELCQSGLRYCINLPDSYQKYLQSVSGKFRNKLNNRFKRLQKLGQVEYKEAKELFEKNEIFTHLISLHYKRWQLKGLSGAFTSPKFIDFHYRLIQSSINNKSIQLHYLQVNDQIAAVFYYFIYDRTIYYYQSGFDPTLRQYALANIMLGQGIEWAINNQFNTFDLMKGSNNSYKREYVNASVFMYNMVAFRSNYKGTLQYYFKMIKKRLRQLIKKG